MPLRSTGTAMLQAEDAGQYRCEVAVQGKNRPQLSHTVRIIGE